VNEKTSYPKDKIKVLLLENVHPSAVAAFNEQGFQVETRTGALSDDELISAISDVHVLGIRSKTQVRAKHLQHARRLLSLGCFCIGTNQVDDVDANKLGIPVFNAPFSNTRSVAELVIAEVIALARQLFDRSREVHEGKWRKVSANCHEVRGKTIGIVGYGHIGSQVGILAEMLGMRVVFYDVATKLPLGNNRPMPTLEALLQEADYVTLHVPATPKTHHMIGERELKLMKKGSYLLNISRGTVVVLPALAEAITAKHIGGAAVDVYPEEPEANGEGFKSELRGLPNVILSPHIGGSTEEAQEAIGKEVSLSLLKFINSGATTGAVNFPQVELPIEPGKHRILNVHHNVPGVLSSINSIVGKLHANISSQLLSTDPNIGYLMMDLEKDVSDEVRKEISELPTNIRTRILY
jgi:D-3-phosphoglycerate dehydrogenase